MNRDKPKNLAAFALKSLLALLGVVVILILLAPDIGSVYHPINATLVPGGPTTAVDNPEESLEAQLAQIDGALKQSLQASLAYNAPASMRLDETVTVELLISPSVPEAELGEQVTAGGPLVTGTLQVTPRMKVELKAADKDAFVIEPLHEGAEQLLSGLEPTRWSWWVTAKQGGLQHLTLVAYRLVQFDGQEYWREVESYRAEIEVKVSAGQRLARLDWKWIAGIALTAVLIPAFWRWVDGKKKKGEKREQEQAGPGDLPG